MLSNNTTNKLKALKSSREYREEKIEDDNSTENTINHFGTRAYSEGNENDKEVGNHSRVMVFAPRTRTRGLLEFCPGHGDAGDRRGPGGRGKSTYSSRREYSDIRGHTIGRKFQEPLNKTNETVNSSHHYRRYDDKNRYEGYGNLPEDPRISKMLRKLCIETDQDKSIAICHKLLDTLMLPDNAKYIRRAFDILTDSLLDVMTYGPCDETKGLASRALGRIGYVMESDFKFFVTWLVKEFTRNRDDEIKILLMKSLIETYTLEQTSSKLFEFCTFALNQIINQLEYADRPEIFMILIDVVLAITECYPEVSTHFRDVVDILVGWLIESNHSPEMADYASRSLSRLGNHWQTNISFSIQLLAQFLEDLVSFGEALTHSSSGSSTPLGYISPRIETSLNQVTALTRVINTILKCLGHCLNPTNSPCITLQFLTDCFVNIVSTATKTLDKYLPENLIIAANESAYILLGYMQSKPAHANEFLYNLIDAELALTQDFNDATLVSMLLLITQTIKEVSANLPLNLVHKLLGPNSEILKMRSSSSIKVQSGVVSVYHSLLNLKNIPLLQEAYRYVLGDLEQCFSVLIPTVKDLCQNNPFSLVTYNKIEAEITTLFLLRCLSDLANASSSIIGMWALKPSILELLAVKLHPYDVKLGFYSPTLQFAILYLLYSHCKRYNHFVSSSSLVFDARTNVCEVLGLPLNLNLGEGATSSPTSGHLTIILDVLTKSLRIQMCSETKNLVLKWSKEIITLSDTYHETLQRKENFVNFIEAVVESGYSNHKEVIIPVYKTLYLLISKKNIKWSNEFLKSVTKLCALHLNSMDDNIRQMYTKLLVKVPWNIKIIELQKFYEMSEIKRKCNNHLFGYNMEAIILAQHLHTSRGTYGEMQTQSFKKFMSYLLFGNRYENNWLKNLFDCSWPLEPVECEDYVADFGNLATSSNTLLLFWAAWESAQFCVNNKLRTALGKPIDTLTNIEIAIKKLAREVGSLNDKSERNLQQNDGLHIEEFKRVRLLLDFMEHFEKVIYNASEGCAVAMLQPDKPVRIFFHTNASTCREWLSRIRVAIIVVALHTGQSAMALRCAQALLQDLCKANNTQGAEFERALMYAAWALLNLNETEAIQGLYVWANDISTRKFSWLKAVAEQACHKYENAAASYEEIIETEVHNKEVIEAESEPEKIKLNNEIDKQLISFMSDQIVECYRNINNWKNLLKWKEHETELLNAMNQNGGTSLHYTVNSISAEYSRILSEFEETDYICTSDLSKWDFELELKKNKNSWSIYNLFENVESNLFNIALKFTKSTDFNLKNIVDECILTIETNICENLCVFPKDLTCNLILFNHIGCSLRNVISKNSTNFDMDDAFEVHTNSENIRKLDLKTLSKVLHWCEYFTSLKCVRGETYLPNLRLEIARIARKEGNFNLARRQIQKYFDLKKELYLASETNGNQWGILENISKSVIECNNLDITIWTYNNVKAIMEAAKLIHTSHDNKEIALNLCAVASLGVSQRLTISDNYDLCEKGTRMLLTLAKWIQTESNSSILNEVSSPVGHLITILPEIGLVESIGTDVIPLQDMAVGKLYQFATNQCPSLAKVWFNFGSWCYRWGRKMVDHSSETGGQLSESDRFAIQSLLPLGSSVDDLQNVYQILSQTRAMTDDEDIESNEINTSEMIEAQLRSVPVLSNVHPDRLSLLVEIWRTAQKRIYSYYELSANSYFKYLQLYNNSETAGVDDCKTITTTLRLLRLIVKHALELQTVLEAGLATTPTQPWKVIIPQLFSRLNHPEGYVRRRVSELLCRVAEDAPHLITFPAVVGAAQGRNKVEFTEITLTKDYLSQQIDDIENDDSEKDTTKVLDSCFMSMVETLSKQAPETITQVQLLVKELRRITLLRDELWLGTLLQHNSEIVKRLSQLEHEILKVNNNVNLAKDEKSRLITEKHRIMMKPVIFILEQLNAITSNEPETPNEKLFQERFDILIKESIEKLKNPVNPEKPKESLQALKVLQNRLQQRAHKRSSYTLKMSEISPVLANMRDTVITMPGLASTSKKLVTILSVDEHVSILPTKTKPKKLIFRGSDGQNYTYLFKGLEDLHLDERIMQFLSIANTMLARSTEISNRNVYRARHYSVIPLGPRSGLISWVDGTTPLFALYKRWQQREAMKACLRQTNSDQNTVLRPSELFYNKLHPLLKEHGVKNPDNRKEWPVAVLKQVLTELMVETPDDLLARELWCHSVDASGWWQTIRSYSHSVAVMSIIGYIIGLGDRHLDNVLVDLASGEVVHIDYNVCFEKGKTLRVPEKVPFRMTPNMRVALGITGVEGIFRLACEHVLKTMKKGRETILTLLEAFVYDPLVDWTMNADSSALVGSTTTAGGNNSTAGITAGGQTRRELEREVTAAMFNVRCAEMRAEWLSNRDDILKQTPIVVQHLTKWLDEESNIKVSEETLHDLHQQMALIKEAEAHASSGKHTLFSLPTRYEAYKRTYDTFKAAKKSLEEKIDDCERRIASHNNALNTIRGPQLGQWIQELNFPIDNESHAVFDPVKEFLQNAGQSSMILQCEQCEKELGQLAQQQSLYIRSCLDLLNQYSAVASNYPSTYVEKHRTVCYLKWCKILLETKSVGVCLDVLSQFESFFAPENVNSPIAQQVVSFSYQLQTILNEANLKLKKSYDRLTAEGIPEVGCRLDKAYNEAKTNIASFLRNEKGSTKALECVNITALCALNKRYLMMEQAAASAGDCLVDLHSMDGDWFLDEMHLMSSLVTELSGMIPTHHNSATKVDDSRVPVILNCLRTANNVYMGLQELNFNFHTIILPEAMKTIQTEDVTVITMINELNEIILNVGCPLPKILEQLELHLRFTIMEMDSPHAGVQSIVTQLRTQYESLLHSHTEQSSDLLTPGKMLLMGFNGLFDKLSVESNLLISSLNSLDTPICWKKVDQFREAKALSAPVFNEHTRSVLDDIFLIKRIQTMTEFFSLCAQTAVGFKGISIATVFDDVQLDKPIRRFTADYVSRRLLGVTSQTIALALCLLLQRMGLNVTNEIEQRDIGAENKVPLEELCKKIVDIHLKRGAFTSNVLAQASSLSSSLENAWRRREIAKYLQQIIEAQRSTLQRIQLQLTAHHWLHEDIIMLQPGLTSTSPLVRSNFMMELRKTSSSLISMQNRLTEAREQQRSLILSVEQRLKWAAGANPALNDVLAAFECAVNIREDRLTVEQNLAQQVGNTCNVLLNHEALRTRTSEGLSHDSSFVACVNQWRQACLLLSQCNTTITQTEESLMQLLPTENLIDINWIQNATTLISNLIGTHQQDTVLRNEAMALIKNNLQTELSKFKEYWKIHHHLMGDIRNLLKSMSKSDECAMTGIQDYLQKYYLYSETITSAFQLLNCENIEENDIKKTLVDLANVEPLTNEIYEDLFKLEVNQNNNSGQISKTKRPPLVRQETVWQSPYKTIANRGQQRNAYAVGVWRRVRMKLEGRDPDPGRKYSLQEQVDYVIREATNIENLALLYEGWTPWV